jgi:hypothetical protein
MKSRALRARRRWPRAADASIAFRGASAALRLLIHRPSTALPQTAIPANLPASSNDPEYRTDASWREHE